MNKDDPKQYLQDVQKMCDKINSRMVRDEVFRPHGLTLLGFRIVPTYDLPPSASAAVDYYRKTVYINCGGSGAIHTLQPEYFIAFALVHEMFHVMLLHGMRIKNRDHFIWGIATDFVINWLIYQLQENSKLGLLNCRNRDYEEHFCMDSRFNGMIEEEVYDYLMQKCNFKQKTYQINIGGNSSGGEGDSQDGDNKDGGNETKPGEGKSKKQGGVEATVTEISFQVGEKKFKQSHIEFPQPKDMTDQEIKDMQDKIQESGILARNMFQQSIGRGIGGTDFQKYLQRLFKIKVDWKKITKDALCTALEKSWERSWNKPSPIYLANAGSLPYLPSRTEEEKLGTVVITIDESGSMGDDDVRDAIGIVSQSKDYFKDLLVLKHDYGEHIWEKYYEDMDSVDIDELLVRRKTGGTSHQWVFKRIVSWLQQDCDRSISCCLIISDMDSDIETSQDILPINLPVIYITNNDRKHEKVKGKIIRIND